MEYKLNKIDTEIRQKVNEASKAGKVHRNKETLKVQKDKKDKKDKNQNKNKEQEEKNKGDAKKITVDGVKKTEVEVDAFKIKEDLKQGRFLDTKRW